MGQLPHHTHHINYAFLIYYLAVTGILDVYAVNAYMSTYWCNALPFALVSPSTGPVNCNLVVLNHHSGDESPHHAMTCIIMLLFVAYGSRPQG